MMYHDFISRQDLLDELFPRGTYILGQAMYAKDVYDAIVHAKGVNRIPEPKIDREELSAYLEQARAKAAGKTDAPLVCLQLSTRTYRALTAHDRMKTVGDLLQCSGQELSISWGIGPTAIAETRECLDAFLNHEI